MDAEHYAQVKQLFTELVGLDEATRAQRLTDPALDPAVVAQVRVLLQHAHTGVGTLQQPVAAALGSLAGDAAVPDVDASGQVLGAWTLERRIGHGGMGSVYLAQRSDGHFAQRAAIKLLRGVASPLALDYLARERQILADLSHPQIARLLDGGSTPHGQPFLVMEYLDGQPIDAWCSSRALTAAAILRLLIGVCRAVAYAHQRLVIHCDLKPSNILVNASGIPVLLDFGIARLLEQGEAGSGGLASPATLRVRAFTPGFASPEQTAGEPLSTATDIYSLGRLLAHLLGTRLQGNRELQAIVERACAPLPMQRYPSADALAQDLGRWLDHQPLQALPPRWTYRTAKLLRRRWPWVLASAVFLLTIAGFTWQLAHDRDRARTAETLALAERDRAVQARTRADRISDFLVSIFDGANPNAGGGEVPTGRLVQQALQRIDQDLDGQPEVQSELYATLARVQGLIGDAQAARLSLQTAIALEMALPAQAARPLVLAARYEQLAALQLASFSAEEAELAAIEADRLYARQRPGDDPVRIGAAIHLAYIRGQLGRFAEADAVLSELRQQLEAQSPHSALLAYALETQADHARAAGRPADAVPLRRQALPIRAAHRATDPASYYAALSMLGRALNESGASQEAEPLMREALAGRRQLHGDDDPQIPWAMAELASVLERIGRMEEALVLYREALDLAATKLGRESASHAVLSNNLALALRAAGRAQEGVPVLEPALRVAHTLWGDASLGVATFRHNLASLHLDAAAPRRALPLLEAAHAVRLKELGGIHADTLATALFLAQTHLDLGDARSARPWLEQVSPHAEHLDPRLQARLLTLRTQLETGP